MPSSSPSVVLFDGVCNFCSASVNFIIRHDRSGRFRFAALQSPAGERYVSMFPELGQIDSVALIEGGKLYTGSSAALRIAKGMDGLWKVFSVFLVVPKVIRDAVYRLFAKNRYRWFGKRETCMVPTKETRARFLTDEEE